MAKNKRAVISAFPPHELQNLYGNIADVPVRRDYLNVSMIKRLESIMHMNWLINKSLINKSFFPMTLSCYSLIINVATIN